MPLCATCAAAVPDFPTLQYSTIIHNPEHPLTALCNSTFPCDCRRPSNTPQPAPTRKPITRDHAEPLSLSLSLSLSRCIPPPWPLLCQRGQVPIFSCGRAVLPVERAQEVVIQSQWGSHCQVVVAFAFAFAFAFLCPQKSMRTKASTRKPPSISPNLAMRRRPSVCTLQLLVPMALGVIQLLAHVVDQIVAPK